MGSTESEKRLGTCAETDGVPLVHCQCMEELEIRVSLELF